MPTTPDASAFAAWSRERQQRIEGVLESLLPAADSPASRLASAMRYATLGGGKRMRPLLAYAASEVAGADPADVDSRAAAVELIHAYSLIHDDLAAMDDDDYRRGRLTNHKVFGEAMAILAGDGLLTHAFRLLADCWRPDLDGAVLRDVLVDLSDAAGSDGMVGGQVADLEAEGKKVGADVLDYIHLHKTAALIRASITVGARLSGAGGDTLRALAVAGRALGLAFQIVDDMLDVTATSAELGKTAGKDQAQQKATYPAVHGLAASRIRAEALTAEALAALAPLGAPAEPLRALARFIIERKA